jgi:methionine synthase II (cobalamin-independent)
VGLVVVDLISWDDVRKSLDTDDGLTGAGTIIRQTVLEKLKEVRKVARNVRSLKQILTMGIGNAGSTG